MPFSAMTKTWLPWMCSELAVTPVLTMRMRWGWPIRPDGWVAGSCDAKKPLWPLSRK
jgi:hypothetical protein